jgi:hypothetical protein
MTVFIQQKTSAFTEQMHLSKEGCCRNDQHGRSMECPDGEIQNKAVLLGQGLMGTGNKYWNKKG